jgi:hypothetical protein
LRPTSKTVSLSGGDNETVRFYERPPKSVTLNLKDGGFFPAVDKVTAGGTIRVCNRSGKTIKLVVDLQLTPGSDAVGENVVESKAGNCRNFRVPENHNPGSLGYKAFVFSVLNDGAVLDTRRSDIFAIGEEFN